MVFLWGNLHVLVMAHVLANLRQQIDDLDGEIVSLLAKRQALVAQVLVVKRQHNLPGRLQDRVDEVINNAAAKAVKVGASPDLARTVWVAMVEWFVRHEEKELVKN
jgi:isochorismate pyruvate lyase